MNWIVIMHKWQNCISSVTEVEAEFCMIGKNTRSGKHICGHTWQFQINSNKNCQFNQEVKHIVSGDIWRWQRRKHSCQYAAYE